jgi:hypothetical protein
MRKTRACAQATLTGVHQIHITKRGSDEFTNGKRAISKTGKIAARRKV